MGPSLNKIEELYDTVAEAYADTFTGEHEKKPLDQVILKRFAQAIGDRRPVWDLGCGPGQTTRYLNDLGVEISGLDLSGKLLAQARARHPELPFQKGNLLALDFEDNAIAGAVAFYAIVHFSTAQVARAFRDVFRVLQPGGVFLLTYHVGQETIHVDKFLGKDVDIDFMLFTTDFIANGLTAQGFELIEIIEREPYPGVEFESRRGYVFAMKPCADQSS